LDKPVLMGGVVLDQFQSCRDFVDWSTTFTHTKNQATFLIGARLLERWVKDFGGRFVMDKETGSPQTPGTGAPKTPAPKNSGEGLGKPRGKPFPGRKRVGFRTPKRARVFTKFLGF